MAHHSVFAAGPCATALLLAIAHQGPACAQQPAVLPNTRAHEIVSRRVPDRYLIDVGLPAGYASDTSRKYPVLYVLDGDKSFGLARDVADWLAWSGEIEPIIVVGISYGQGWWSKRARDMTLGPDRARVWGDFPTAGGASRFTAFLREELIPFVDITYRSDADRRALAGLSLGGLYGAIALFTEPALFNRFILVGPAFAWDSMSIGRLESEFAADSTRARRLSALVYTAIGENDDEHVPGPWRDLVATIRARSYPGLTLHDEVLSGETHISAWPIGLTRGLRRLFPPAHR